MFILEPRILGYNSFDFSISLINEDEFGNIEKELLIYEEYIGIDVEYCGEDGVEYNENRSIIAFGNEYSIEENYENYNQKFLIEKIKKNDIDISAIISCYDFDVLTIINSIFHLLYNFNDENYIDKEYDSIHINYKDDQRLDYKLEERKRNIISKAILLFLQKNNLKLFDFNNVLVKLRDATDNQQNFTYLFEIDNIYINNNKICGKTDDSSVFNKFMIDPDTNTIYKKIQNLKSCEDTIVTIERKINLYTGINNYSLEI